MLLSGSLALRLWLMSRRKKKREKNRSGLLVLEQRRRSATVLTFNCSCNGARLHSSHTPPHLPNPPNGGNVHVNEKDCLEKVDSAQPGAEPRSCLWKYEAASPPSNAKLLAWVRGDVTSLSRFWGVGGAEVKW